MVKVIMFDEVIGTKLKITTVRNDKVTVDLPNIDGKDAYSNLVNSIKNRTLKLDGTQIDGKTKTKVTLIADDVESFSVNPLKITMYLVEGVTGQHTRDEYFKIRKELVQKNVKIDVYKRSKDGTLKHIPQAGR